MKTISFDHPVRVYFKDGECYHDSATIMIANGFPSFVRGKNPDVIYPWENVIRVADEPTEADITKRLRASIAAIADERNGAKQEVHALREEVARVQALHTEHRLALRAALGLRDDEAADHVTGDFKALCERVSNQRKSYESAYRTAYINSDDAHRLSKTVDSLQRDLASVTEQRDVLKRQLEELRAEMRKPTLPQPKQAEPGGPIWVRVVDTTSKFFDRVGRLEGISFRGDEEVWSVGFGALEPVHHQACAFAIIGTGRQGPSESPKPDAEHQQAQNRDQWRATCLAYGAKDCSVYFGPGDEVTFVVELKDSYRLEDIRRGLYNEHGLRPDQFTLREVRPGILAKMRTASEP